jgi:hypothetical protein
MHTLGGGVVGDCEPRQGSQLASSAPKGPFNLTMRLYAPKRDALTGEWNPPPVTKTESAGGEAQ